MSDIPFTIAIPQHLQEDIVNRLEDAVHIARVKCVCKSFQNVANRVRSLRIICKEEYHASVRDNDPKFILPIIKCAARGGGDRGGIVTSSSSPPPSSSQAKDSAPVGIPKKSEDDVTLVTVPLHATQKNSINTSNGVPLGDYLINSNHKHPPPQTPQDNKVEAEEEHVHDGALHEFVPPGIDVIKRHSTRCREEDQSDVGIGRRKRTSIDRNGSSDPQALQNTSKEEDRHEPQRDGHGNGAPQETLSDGHGSGVPQETLRDGHGNGVPQETLRDGHGNGVPQETLRDGHGNGLPQETLRDNDGNFQDGHSSKKPKLEGEFRAGDSKVGEAGTLVTKEPCDTYKGARLRETLRDDNGNFLDGCTSRKPNLQGVFRVGVSHSGEASTSVTKEEEQDMTSKGHLRETLRYDDNGNINSPDGKLSNKKAPEVLEDLEFCDDEDPQEAGGDDTSDLAASSKEPIYFRHIVPTILRETECVGHLRLEIEPKLQSKLVPESERKFTDHWLTDPLFVRRWIPSIQNTIQHLCIVDYGQQAIMRRSSLLTVLSETCFVLKTLDLRNMFLNMKGCKDMPYLTSFTLRCVKVQGDALEEINARMRNLQTLALLGVFGVQEGHLTFPELKVLCLGLSTKAKSVKVELPKLVKLQLKMSCPEVLHMYTPTLKFVAFNLEILDCSLVGFENIQNLRELLYGSSNFATLSKLMRRNVLLDKMFLDIPCMALGEDGKWLGVLKEVLLEVPPFETLQSECPNLQVLNVGPGLWHSMEMMHYTSLVGVRAWPPITRLILHMIPHTLTRSVAVLLLFVTVMPKLHVLEVKVHTNSEVDYDSFIDAIKGHVAHLNFRPGKWTKSLDFSCFSF